MLIMSRRAIAKEKVNQLLDGHTAFAESEEVKRIIKRDIKKQNMLVVCDETEAGCWFIPENPSNDSQ